MKASPKGYQLILDFEVGGGRFYFERKLARPTWPGGESGVTIGIGYDLGFNSRATIRSNWEMLPAGHLNRLCRVAGLRLGAARNLIRTLSDIVIPWTAAERVFETITLPRFFRTAADVFAGLEKLEPDAQWALLSLVFNRGESLKGSRRLEMRNIVGLVPKRDYAGIANEIRAMKRLWRGTDIEAGMSRRREAEARLVEACAR